MLTTLQLKSTLISNTCQWRQGVSDFINTHLSVLFRSKKSESENTQPNPSVDSTQDTAPIILSSEEPEAEILDCLIGIVIPSQDFKGRKIKNRKMINEVKELFAKLFGGYTVYPGIGGWNSSSGQLIEENIIIIESYTSQVGFEFKVQVVRLIALELKRKYRQESVAIRINNTLHLL